MNDSKNGFQKQCRCHEQNCHKACACNDKNCKMKREMGQGSQSSQGGQCEQADCKCQCGCGC